MEFPHPEGDSLQDPLLRAAAADTALAKMYLSADGRQEGAFSFPISGWSLWQSAKPSAQVSFCALSCLFAAKSYRQCRTADNDTLVAEMRAIDVPLAYIRGAKFNQPIFTCNNLAGESITSEILYSQNRVAAGSLAMHWGQLMCIVLQVKIPIHQR